METVAEEVMRLSICSGVYFSEPYLNLNRRLTDLSGVDHEWLVVDNTIADRRLTTEPLEPGFTVLPGVPREPLQLTDGCIAIGQLQHGLSLNKCVRQANKPDFLLLLDPDFFTLVPVLKILQYMVDNDLALFGSPYMSKTPLTIDFPVAFNLFVDVRKIPIDSLDFTPGYGAYKNSKVYPDCGYKVYTEALRSGTKYEATIPSAAKAKFKHTAKSLADYGIVYDNTPNEKGTKIDEYFWKDKPYAVHTRAKLNQGRNFTIERMDSQLEIVRMIYGKLNAR